MANVRDLARIDWESGPDRKLAHNTYRVSFDDGSVGVVFHRTLIIQTGRWDGTYILNSGGYRTSTTKQRLNALTPAEVQIYQRNFDWFVSTRGGDIPFSDGMHITTGPGW